MHFGVDSYGQEGCRQGDKDGGKGNNVCGTVDGVGEVGSTPGGGGKTPCTLSDCILSCEVMEGEKGDSDRNKDGRLWYSTKQKDGYGEVRTEESKLVNPIKGKMWRR